MRRFHFTDVDCELALKSLEIDRFLGEGKSAIANKAGMPQRAGNGLARKPDEPRAGGHPREVQNAEFVCGCQGCFGSIDYRASWWPGDGAWARKRRGKGGRTSIRRAVKAASRKLTGPGLRFAPLAPIETAKEKPKREKKPKQKNDPKMIAAARELRDRWLEQMNAGGYLPESHGRYDVSRAIADEPAARTLVPAVALPSAA
jgi:hypothetical protein